MARIFISHSSADNDQAAQMKAWLASAGFESAFLDKDKTTGIPPGADWERTLYRAVEQSQAMIIIQTPNWLASKWCFAEFTQARALGKAIFPAIVAPTGDTLISPDIQALNLLGDRDGGLERLKRELVRIALDAQGGFEWDARRSPYPGMLAFDQEDAAVYFGRDDDIRRLSERLEARRNQGGAKLIALLGSSGSGKSSLLRAGVIPRLKRAGRNWIVVSPMRPQSHPVDELATALATARDPWVDWEKVRDDLIGSDPVRALDGFSRSLRGEARANEARILIPIDQAEELFGVADPDEARRFLAILSQVLSESLPFMAVMTIRSDFLGQLQSATSLTARFEEFSLGPMPLSRIPQVIEGPARRTGLRVEDEFVRQAAHDAETEDALPLLAFTLRQLFDQSAKDQSKERCLTLQAYKALGDEAAGLTPLENAVRKAADTVLDEANATDEEKTALREAFVPAMVRVNEQGEYVRRPARMDALPAKSNPLLERLAKARLLIIRQEGDARVVEVAHEALLRKWSWLKERLDAERVFLIGKQQLEQDLRDWQAAADKDKADALLIGLKLTRARAWLVDHPTRLTTDERVLIQASIDHAEAEERRKIRLRRNITRASIAAALVLACVAVFAVWQWRKTQEAFRARAVELIRYVWIDLGSRQEEIARLTAVAKQHSLPPKVLVQSILEKVQPDGFDCKTWLDSGFRHAYCSIRNVVSFEKVQSIAGFSIFRPGGPHDKELDLGDPYRFGHYNPEFLDWLDDYIIPQRGANDVRFNQLTRLVYETQIGPVARALYHSHEILFADPETFGGFEQRYRIVKEDYLERLRRRETIEGRFDGDPKAFATIKADYHRRLEQRTDPRNAFQLQEDFRWLSDYLATDKDDDWYLANTAGGFWVRRSIDGTEAQIFRLLTKFLQTFDAKVVGKPSPAQAAPPAPPGLTAPASAALATRDLTLSPAAASPSPSPAETPVPEWGP